MRTAILALALAAVASAAPFSVHSAPENEALRLIETSPSSRQWMTESQIALLKESNVGFMDVTDFQLQNFMPAEITTSALGIPTAPKMQTQVKALLPNLSASVIREKLTKFTSFKNRYYTAATGAESAQWLFDQLSAIAAKRSDITVTKFEHKWAQFSVIVRIEGTSGAADTVICGAHQDSINGSSLTPSTATAPGADDDGSGSMTNMEIFRVLAESGYKPTIPLEFHFYSGEEAGLLGSQAVATQYANTKRVIRGMYQIDMDGYVKPKTTPVFGIVTDYTDSTLNGFIRTLATTYTSTKPADTKCGYACSDHGSFNKLGYPAAFPFEALFENDSPYIHKTTDTIDTLDFDHILEFARLGLSFAVEMTN